MKMKLHNHLQFMLEHKRPAYGNGWKATLNYVKEVIHNADHFVTIDDAGNLVCTTEFTGVLFSCHLDTVHRVEGNVEVCVDDFGIVTGYHQKASAQSGLNKDLSSKRERCVLGADDAAGAYIMLRMIEENYPGTYVFHNAEEIGCLGSKAIADNDYSVGGYDLQDDFTHAIAFDRKGTSDFIYKQLDEVMCSGECTADLITRLSSRGLNYRREIGLVTDTAMYADYVQECINLSVGYYDEHTAEERLDSGHVDLLLDTILADRELFTGLPVARDNTVHDFGDGDSWYGATTRTDLPSTILGLIEEYPMAIADLLEEQFGYDFDELFDTLNQMDALP